MSKQTTKEKMLTLCVHSGLPRYKHHLLPKPLASPPSYFMNIRELMLAGRESRKGLGQREKERLVREASVGKGRVRRADIVTGPGSAQALNELGWLPIDWKTTGYRRTDKGVCGLTGEGRDTDQSSHYTSPPWILLSLCFFTLEWMRLLLLISGFCCEGRCLFFFSEKILPTHHARTKTAPLTTGNLSSCLHSNPDVCSSSPSRYSGPSFASCYHLCLVTMVSSLLSLPHYLFFSPSSDELMTCTCLISISVMAVNIDLKRNPFQFMWDKITLIWLFYKLKTMIAVKDVTFYSIFLIHHSLLFLKALNKASFENAQMNWAKEWG